MYYRTFLIIIIIIIIIDYLKEKRATKTDVVLETRKRHIKRSADDKGTQCE